MAVVVPVKRGKRREAEDAEGDQGRARLIQVPIRPGAL